MDSFLFSILDEISFERIEEYLNNKIKDRDKMPQLVKFVTPMCPHCKLQSIVYVDEKSLKDWQNGVPLQDAFVDMPADERELLKTGIHAECWAEIFSENA